MPEECAVTTANLGRAYESLAEVTDAESNLQQAVDHYNKALEFCPFDEDSLVREIKASLGTAYEKLARLTGSADARRRAIQALEESIHLHQPGRAGLDTFNAAWALGDVAWGEETREAAFGTDTQAEHKRRQVAARGYLQAVEILDTLLAGATLADQALLIERARKLYPRAIKMAYDLGLLEECLITIERAKGRLLLYELAQTDFYPPTMVPHSMVQEEQILVERRETLRQLLREAEQGDTFLVRAPKGFANTSVRTASRDVTRSSLWQELDTVEAELQALYRRMESIAPDYVDIRCAATPSIEDIQRFVCDQGRGTTLLSYYTLPDSILVFGLTAERKELIAEEIHKPLSMLIEELGPLLNYDSIDNPFVREPEHPNDPAPRMLFDLSAELLPEKIAQLLESTSRLYVIPAGPLHWLPFQTLLWGEEPLIRRFPVIQSPGISVAIRAQKRRREGRLPVAAFGFAHKDEDKPTFEGEARQIGAMLGGRARVGRRCNRASVHNLAKSARVLHISSHGSFKPLSPLDSGVDLADGLLTAREVMKKLRLPGSLVTLSACETGYNAVEVGDELIGLMRAFFYAGASSLILSMWSVDAPTTMDLMAAFYKSVRRGESRADALRTAALTIRESRSHPFYWAPFVLLGDWQ